MIEIERKFILRDAAVINELKARDIGTEQKEVTSYAEVMKCDTEKFKVFFHKMLDLGVYLAPSAFEAGFMSLAHTDEDIAKTLEAADIAFAALA